MVTFSELWNTLSNVGVYTDGVSNQVPPHPHSRCLLKCSAKIPAQSEDEPIGWFELESEWNDTEIQLQQCRVAKVHPARY